MIKKADIFLGIFLIILCLCSLLLLGEADSPGSIVTVSIDGELYGTYDLSSDQQVKIQQKTETPHLNIIEIKDSAVLMVQSDCKNQVCVNQGRISRTHQTIVCLPNHVVVSISGGEGTDGDMDAVSY